MVVGVQLGGGRAAACRLLRRLVSRAASSAAAQPPPPPPPVSDMSAWQIHRYGGLDELELTNTRRVPPITCPWDVLVRVRAASVNPIDTAMLGGYGSATLNVLRGLSSELEFPLTLGRDLSGEVVAVGGAVTRFRPGDQVWAAIGAQRQGTHAQYVVASSHSMSLKPVSVGHEEAASLPYVAATAWSALVVTAELWSDAARRDTRVLVLGASGGVGTFAVQLLKAWNCEVTATCATDAVPLLETLGADVVVDYTTDSADEQMTLMRGFDVILDCTGECTERHLPLLKPWKYSKYVTLSPPFLRNIDQEGLVSGGLRNLQQLVLSNLTSHSQGRTFRWAFFMPNGWALDTVRQLVDDNKIRPVVERKYPFSDAPAAFAKVSAGHNRGKVVLSLQEPSVSDAEAVHQDDQDLEQSQRQSQRATEL